MELDWTEFALVGIIVFVTVILLVVFCRWLRRDNEERAYREELERRHGFHMVQDPASMGVWEIWSANDAREMQQLSPSIHTTCSSPPPGDCPLFNPNRRISNPRAKRVGSRLEAISE